MSDPLDASFVGRALAAIQSIRMDATDLELDIIASLAREIQTSLQQIAEQETSPKTQVISKILQQTHRLRQSIEVETDEPDSLDDRKTTRNAGMTQTPAPKRVRPQFTVPPAAKRLEELMGEIELRLDDYLTVDPKSLGDQASNGDSDLPSPTDKNRSNDNE